MARPIQNLLLWVCLDVFCLFVGLQTGSLYTIMHEFSLIFGNGLALEQETNNYALERISIQTMNFCSTET